MCVILSFIFFFYSSSSLTHVLKKSMKTLRPIRVRFGSIRPRKIFLFFFLSLHHHQHMGLTTSQKCAVCQSEPDMYSRQCETCEIPYVLEYSSIIISILLNPGGVLSRTDTAERIRNNSWTRWVPSPGDVRLVLHRKNI